MSDELAKNESKLCISESAFEQFQERAMYEEDEFITLSDIVPPEPYSDGLSIMNDLMNQDEPVCPMPEDQVNQNSKCQEIEQVDQPTLIHCATETETIDVCRMPEDQVNQNSKCQEIEQVDQPTPIHCATETETIDVVSVDNAHNNEILPRMNGRRGRKRGRGRKKAVVNNNVQSNLDSSKNENLLPLETTTPPKRGRRGQKPAQQNLDVTVDESVSVQTRSIEKQIDEAETSKIKEAIPKRGRRKKVFGESITNGDEILNKSEIDSKTLPSPNVSPPAKRGRRSKKTIEETIEDKTVREDKQEDQNTEKNTVSDPIQEDEDGDDICLSDLKRNLGTSFTENLGNSVMEESTETLKQQSKGKIKSTKKKSKTKVNDSHPLDNTEDNNVAEDSIDVQKPLKCSKRKSKKPTMADYEYNIDKAIDENINNIEQNENNTQESPHKIEENIKEEEEQMQEEGRRPRRRKARKTYEIESDEDPFAGDDDEYIPGGKQNKVSSEDSSIDSAPDEHEEFLGRKKKSKKLDLFNELVTTVKPDATCSLEDDIEVCLETSVIKATEDLDVKLPKWNSTREFESFLAKKSELKIKKVSSSEPTNATPLTIPTIDSNRVKKLVEISTQTNAINRDSKEIQTDVPGAFKIKDNMPLTDEQSKKACEFLKNIVQTTSELGQLMIQKSEDFIKKKINTDHVTDTIKMDYCIQKSLLLFKLAKHNLTQMEDDLTKQYSDFLNTNKLAHCKQEQKSITPKIKVKNDNDSDCEIVEVPTTSTKRKKTFQFNPKTVFLNKELSIKIAKKPEEVKKKENLNLKERHSVWISDSVMVKKVKPSQSFLAQDSRNKKPPDCFVTIKMVNDFFKKYERQKVLQVCAPFVKLKWDTFELNCQCYYFFLKPETSNENGNANGFESDLSEPSSSGLEERTDLCDLKCNTTNMIEVKTLSKLCIEFLETQLFKQKNVDEKSCINTFAIDKNEKTFHYLCQPDSLLQLSLSALNSSEKIKISMSPSAETYVNCESESEGDEIFEQNKTDYDINFLKNGVEEHFQDSTMIKSLFTHCVNYFQHILNSNIPNEKHLKIKEIKDKKLYVPQELKAITYRVLINLIFSKLSSPSKQTESKPSIQTLSFLCFKVIGSYFNRSSDKTILQSTPKLAIDCVNSLTEEAFRSIDNGDCDNGSEIFENIDDDCDSFYSDQGHHSDIENNDEENPTAESWVSQLQNELKCCFVPTNNQTLQEENEAAIGVNEEPTSDENEEPALEENEEHAFENQPVPHITHIKLEPLEEPQMAVEMMNIKTEPELDEMTVLPDNIITKMEHIENARDPIETHTCQFNEETFVRTSKGKMAINEEDEIFSQSALRVRRQHDPDSDNEYDISPEGYGLLVPQTFEELKETLMESSESESESKKTDKPKEKRRGRPKKLDKKIKSKDLVLAIKPTAPEITPPQLELKEKENQKGLKEKEIQKGLKENENQKGIKENQKGQINEVAMLTRRMKEKIQQEEKKIESSDSDSESMTLRSRKDKDKSSKPKMDKRKPKKISHTDSEIQCNDVDSTEVTDNTADDNQSNEDSFTGFSAVDQNETSSYEKYVKFIYNKILPSDNDMQNKKTTEADVIPNLLGDDNVEVPLINPDEPVELLECEPTMPIFDNETEARKPGRKTSKKKAIVQNETTEEKRRTEKVEKPLIQKVEEPLIQKVEEPPIQKVEEPPQGEFVTKDGWYCFPVLGTDPKLYESSYIPLEKLPETFVETYLMYQNITEKDPEDLEIERLTNLQSLNKSTFGKQTKTKSQHRTKQSNDEQITSDLNADSRPASPTYSDHYAELTPSEDEGANVEDEVPPAIPLKSSDNHLAKNALMDDYESDEDTPNKLKIKQEPGTEPQTPIKKYRPGPKSKTKMGLDQTKVKVEDKSPDNLMITADKTMGKELALLHAPVTLNDDIKNTPGKPAEKKHSSGSKRESHRERQRSGDDSSSEEEKQWANKKEKILKSMERKQEVSVDDAKRAKLESDFIKRRGDTAITEAHHKTRGGRRRSRKKMLEREKQMSVLSRELFGDNLLAGKKSSQASFGKGRRNIRKVIDKKSLARSTVIANMEEFERKRRLNIRQQRLREVLGCEEGVNVLVINDEVCLEYDFDQHMPVVTVHPFFTRVMKAHQYEGVKFMWDACFESLEMMESGSPGGGCILAHCMGLGKTLQVLALLHTVLTHPRVGMQRVLVCCPLSTVLNWVDEIHKWIGPVTNQIKVFELSKLKKTYERAYQLEDWYSGGGIFIIGYELFRSLSTLDPVLDDIRPTIVNKIRTALLDPGPDIIICDEGHLLKNDCSVLAVAMSRVQTKRRIMLTGTPMQNNLREYYCMVNFVKPNLLGTYAEYSNRFENPIMNGQHRDSQEEDIKLMKARTHILHKVLEGCLQRQEASVLYPYLPKKHEYTVFITLTKVQVDLYKYYLEHYARKNKVQVLKDFQILQKIWTHPHVLDHYMKPREHCKIKTENLEDDLAHEDITAAEDVKPVLTEKWWLEHFEENTLMEALESSNKFVAVFQILNECVDLGDKVLIFSTSLFTMDSLEYFLQKIKKWSLGQEYYRLDGKVPAEVRQKWCREFNAENNTRTKLFLISTRAGSLGLNMVAANRVIILDTSWNPAHDIQSIFRVYRFGQKKDCYIYRLVALGTMEQKIYERSVTKQAISCRVVDEQQIDRHYNSAELTELYSLDETGCGVAAGVAAGVEDVVLLRVARSAALHAAHEHDSLLRGSTEQQLPEHERHAAWMQFQQEQAHKQIQNQLGFHYGETKNNLKRQYGHQPSQPLLYGPLSHQYGGLPAYVPFAAQDHIYSQPLPPQYHSQYSQYPMASTSHGPPMVQIKTENDQLPLLQPLPGSKAKKGRPSKNINNPVANTRIPGMQEQPNQAPIPIQINEAAMVEKISTILIEHQFHQNHKPSEIAALIQNVRQLIKSGNVSKTKNDLANCIARIIMAEEQAANQMPPLTDVKPIPQEQEPEPISSIPEPQVSDQRAKRSRGRPKKDRPVDEYVPPPQNLRSTKPEVYPAAPSGRGRRKAALVAEQSIDSITSDAAVDMDNENDGDWLASDDLPIQQIKTEAAETITPDVEVSTPTPKVSTPTPKIRPGPKSKKKGRKSANAEKSIPATEPTNASAIPTAPVDEIQNIISLIDDDEDEPPVVATNNQSKSNEQKEQKVEKVPLHPSLLSNKNFIKIVAHTYVTGNPMLDDDAALLAAQYSTLKALKEIEGTGKVLDSGPIYDIAIKVLGIEILKKLHKTGGAQENEDPKTASKKPQEVTVKTEPEPESTRTSRRSEKMENEQIIKTENDTSSKMRGKIKAKLTSLLMPQSSETPEKLSKPKPKPVITIPKSSIVPPPPVPVPVMINRASNNLPQNHSEVITADECILPDDDDVIISDSNPTQLQVQTPKGHMLMNQAIPLPASPQEQEFQRISTSARINSQTINVNNQVNQKANDDTICLDSDEEIQPEQEPVPVAIQPAQPSAFQIGSLNPSALRNYQTQLLQNLPQKTSQQLPQQQSATPANAQPTRTSGRRQRKLNIPASAVTQSIDLDDNEATPSNATKPTNAPKILNSTLPENTYSQNSNPLLTQIRPVFVVNQQSGQIKPVNQLIQSDIPLQNTTSLGEKRTSKTVCKPGDVIRINKGGQVELLNRVSENDTPVTNVSSTPPTDIQTRRKSGRKAEQVDYTSSIMVTSHKKREEPKAPEPQMPAYKEKQKSNQNKSQKVGSSSSDSSREQSPERRDDPLAIFQNVVHIQAADEPKSDSTKNSRSASKQSLVKNQPQQSLVKNPPQQSLVKNPPQQSLVKNPPQRTSATIKTGQNSELLKKLKNIKVVPSSSTIDLTDSSTPSSSQAHKSYVTSKSIAGPSKPNIPNTKFALKKLPSGALANAKTISLKTISGTSKDIILKGGSGKPTLMSTVAGKPDLNKKILVTNMETIKNLETKKRSLPDETKASKKKKLSDMTLKDFDLDDIDDIIELE